MGRLCVWSQAAFDALDSIYGDGGKNIPQPEMINADLARLINSDEIQSVVNPAKRSEKKPLRKKNAMKSIKALEKLDPYAAAARRSETAAMEARAGKKAETLAKKRAASKAKKAFKAAGKAFYEAAVKQGDVCANGFGI
jgi:large subunit ribosomal protein L4e